MKRAWLTFLLLSKLNSGLALNFIVPTEGGLVGKTFSIPSSSGDTLSEIGIRYDIGYYEMLRANPQIEPNGSLSPNIPITIPAEFILPDVPHKGVIINLAEYRLYYFPPNDNIVVTMPVGIGRKGWLTPIGITKIISKERNPTWRPTAELRTEAEKKGMLIPNAFPPGEGNPLGRQVLRLGWPTYLIHGTNRRDGVGARVSAGCLRMLPEDIEYLFELVPKGTLVRVINEPVKLGLRKGSLYIQVHPKLIEQNDGASSSEIARQLKKFSALKINQKILEKELQNPSGIPRKIT